MRHAKTTVVILMLVLNVMLFPNAEAAEQPETETTLPASYQISISGGVVFPGTYTFYRPVYVSDVIVMSGGFSDDAVKEAIDQSRLISTKAMINVPVSSETTNISLLVNINTASFQELLEIPFMTEKRAVSLLVYRETMGPFMHVDELINVKNIGPVTLENLRPYVTVG